MFIYNPKLIDLFFMFIEPHFVGISPTQLPLGTGGPHQQGFINNYKVICFFVNTI